MSGNVLFLLELLFGAGVALGFAAWELVKLKRYREQREREERSKTSS
ncbi:MAG: hypothetical protein K2X67_05710 [Burkholderiales bacterium]|nr:hypothetical protein [Burkholderiales bacterium]